MVLITYQISDLEYGTYLIDLKSLIVSVASKMKLKDLRLCITYILRVGFLLRDLLVT